MKRMKQPLVVHWFRQDLRLSDNPALNAAASRGKVLPLYILDDVNAGEHAMGGASRWWLHHSLIALQNDLNGSLVVAKGDAKKILVELVQNFSIQAVYWNRCYEPWRVQRDTQIESELKSLGITTASFNGSLLWEPKDINKPDGTPYKVFTHFYRKGCLSAPEPRNPLSAPENLELAEDLGPSMSIEDLELLPTTRWDLKLENYWKFGEEGAQERLNSFLKSGLYDYKKGRDFPADKKVSKLSPYLHFGQISPNQVWYVVKAQGNNKNVDHYLSELGWREFSYYQLYHYPHLPDQNMNTRFNNFPWKDPGDKFKRWCKGQTGCPIVDAGMRELWETGYMHNRTRMITASFLTKNMMVHWWHGEQWFWDCLVDADLASNSAGWQWVAGCGADAAPYYRIFNPVLQGQKFDPEGNYIRRYVPELKDLPNKYLACPWEAPVSVLREAGVKLGETYPRLLVDIQASRNSALAAFNKISR